MKIRTKNLAWMTAASCYAVVGASPTLADDTELLLINPSSIVQPKANVMFIIDTSGSMDTEEETAQAYDSADANSGACDTNKLYWTTVGSLPVCDPATPDVQSIDKATFQCDDANRRISGIGNYTGTLAQWRAQTITNPGNASSVVYSWQGLDPNNATDFVECENDGGEHGDGTAGEVYATAYSEVDPASGIGNPWVSDPAIELSWGSAPRNVEYTIYDGEWLNWNATPAVLVDLERIDIVRDVTKTVLDSIDNINVGLMRFNDNDGGPVIHAIADLDANRAVLNTKLDALDADGSTPLSEVLYESALYWNGLPAEFGVSGNIDPQTGNPREVEHTIDPAALVSASGPEVYRSPVLDSCAKNYNILLSDGNPNSNEEAPGLVPTLPGFANLTGKTACDSPGSDGDQCLDDIGEYLKLRDTDSILPEIQNVTTHTIGFTDDIDVLIDTAAESGGRYFRADNVQELTRVLLEIVSEITDKSLAFSAPAVSVNTFNRTQNLNDIYVTMFGVENKVHWPGNIKKYTITNRVLVDAANVPILDADGNEQIVPTITDTNGRDAVNPGSGFFLDTAEDFWGPTNVTDGNDVLLGGGASRLTNPGGRNLYTNSGTSGALSTAASNELIPGNSALVATDFGLTGSADEPTLDDLLLWMRGQDIRDEDNDGSTTDARNAMGDPLHAQPASIVYGGSPSNPDVVVYAATNDGYLHAIDADTGDELWAFVPNELLPRMTRLYFDPDSKFKDYGLDGNIVPIMFDDDKDGTIETGDGDFVRIIFGMRRGGSSYYMLDVSNKNAPVLEWIASPSGIGQTWSTPVVARVDAPGLSTGNTNSAVVILGGGYDPVHDTVAHPAVDDAVGANIIMLDLETGTEVWRAGRNAGPASSNLVLSSMTNAIPGDVQVVDLSGDGFADRMYAADLGGQILRFDIYNGVTGDDFVTGGVIAQLGAEQPSGSPTLQNTRRFYTSPDVSLVNSNILGNRFLAISIGSGYRAHPLDNIANDRFYSLRDFNVFRQLTQIEYNGFPIIRESNLVEVSGSVRTSIAVTDRGWMLTLPFNQKVLSSSITFNDSIFFASFSPDSNLNNACVAGVGSNFLYQLDVNNGDPVVTNLDTITATEADLARSSPLQQVGIAPPPTVLFPTPDAGCTGAACNPPPLICVGSECVPDDEPLYPVRTLWTQDGIQ